MPATTPDPLLVLAVRAQIYTGTPAEPIPRLWLSLQTAITNYNMAVASSLSSEGINRTMDIDAAREQVIIYYTAYRDALAAAAVDLPAGTDPVLLERPMGFVVDHSYSPLRC